MAPNKTSLVRKLPIIKQYKEDRERREHQDSYFAALYSDSKYLESEPTVIGWLQTKAPSRNGTLKYITDTFPCLKWVPRYNFQWFLGDLIAGVTVGAVIVPKSMAYAKLAQLPVQYGLYTSVFGGAVYWLFGTSKDIAVGPVAVASIITAQIVHDIEQEHPNESLSSPAIASAVAMLAGSLIVFLGILRLGWLVDMISLPAVAAFITGSSVTVVLGQFPALVGMRHINSRDPAVKIALNILKNLKRIRIDAAFGVSALILLYGIKWSCASIGKRRPALARKAFFVSSLRAVSVIFIFTIISYAFNHNRKDNPMIRLIGFIPRGFQISSPPRIERDMIGSLLGEVPVVSIIMLIEHISIAKEFGRINNYSINPSSEFLAVGFTNILGPLVGAFAATGSVSGTAINAKAGARTPMCGVFTAVVVVIAMYTMTPAFFFVPTSALAAIIIHAIGDLVTPPSTLYEFWKISPVDVIVFIIGLTITLVNSIENGVYAMIALSLIVLLFRTFQANGSFLGSIKIRTVPTTVGNEGSTSDPPLTEKPSDSRFDEDMADAERRVFLPLDRKDGSNPRVQLETPDPGIFIYRLKEGFNYTNCNKQLDDMVAVITSNSRRGKPLEFEKPGDRPWNESGLQDYEDGLEDARPRLDAIILDFSTVENVDLTSIQYLIDIRNVLDRHAAPRTVQWHFACVYNVWSKRALAAAGFGYPSFETADGRPQHFKPIYSLANMSQSDPAQQRDDQERAREESEINPTRRQSVIAQDIGIGGIGGLTDQAEKLTIEALEVTDDGKITKEQMGRMEAIHGINRPFFHPDVQSALTSAIASKAIMEAFEQSSAAQT